MRQIVLACLFLFPAQYVLSHAQFSPSGTTPPRVNNAGIKTGPCGGYSRTDKPTFFSPGETFQLEWIETIQHPGYFTFMFSQSGDNFTTQVAPQFVDNQDSRNDLPHYFSTMGTMPNTPCTECAIQLIQVMTEGGGASRYFSCADVVIVDPADTTAPDVVTGLGSSATANTVSITWNNPADFYKVLILHSNSFISDVPGDRMAYAENETIGSSEVIYVGNGSEVIINNLSAGNHYFKVFSYDGSYNYSAGMDTYLEIVNDNGGSNPPVSTGSDSGSGGLFWTVFVLLAVFSARIRQVL